MPYLVYSDFGIPSAAKLTIAPGVVVKFRERRGYQDNRYLLSVDGTLDLLGTPGEEIVFTESHVSLEGLVGKFVHNAGLEEE